MIISQQVFQKRLRRIMRRRRQLLAGFSLKLDGNNLLVAHPRHVMPRFPWRAIAMVLVIGFAFKAYLIAALGDATYLSRLGGLTHGHALEQAGAWVMQPDPASQVVAGLMRQLGV